MRGRGADLRQEVVQVKTAVGGRERGEPPLRLLQLALVADPVSPPGLVPRHGDVDESLEEVALFGVGRTPDVLEHLMGGEELARLDQAEAFV